MTNRTQYTLTVDEALSFMSCSIAAKSHDDGSLGDKMVMCYAVELYTIVHGYLVSVTSKPLN